jgi:predicted metal-dependent phosphotriesterase family hydrolase
LKIRAAWILKDLAPKLAQKGINKKTIVNDLYAEDLI